MAHSRHYSLEEASGLLAELTELLERMRSARDRLSDADARAALAAASGSNGGGQPGRTVSEGFLELRDAMIWLRRREIVLRDLDRGLIDFPSMRDGAEVYLCWQVDEDEISFWHELEAGFAGRRPLDDG